MSHNKRHKWLYCLIIVLILGTVGVGTASAQDFPTEDEGGDIIQNQTFQDGEEVNIDTVVADSGDIRIGDVEWDDDSVTMTIQNGPERSTVFIADQGGIVSADDFIRVPQTSIILGSGEAVKVTLQATNDDTYGQIVGINQGNQIMTLRNDAPDTTGTIDTVGWATWYIPLGILTTLLIVAGRVKLSGYNEVEKAL